MSKHLRVLRASGVVDEQRVETDARIHLYQLRPEPFLVLQAWLDQVQAYWTGQLAAFKEHAEHTAGARAQRAKPSRSTPAEQANEEGNEPEEHPI